MLIVDAVETKNGLTGDRYARRSGTRQAEHLPVIASVLGFNAVDPALLRRNICVNSINLHGLKDKQFQISTVNLQYTGLCHPCSFIN